jgi:carboxyl-terminal processing protease
MRRLALVLLAAAAALAPAQTRDREALITRLETRALSTWHYEPAKIDDAFSRRVFDLYLKRLDPQKRFLLKADVDSLARFRDRLDDQLQASDYSFAEKANALLNRRVEEARALVSELLKKELDFNAPDSLVVDADKIGHAADAEALRARWVSLLKFQVLARLDGKRQEAADKDTLSKKAPPLPDSAAIRDAKAYVERNLQRSFARMIREDKLDRVSVYLGAVANAFDPHTEYFKPQAREEFNMAMSGTLEGIGASLREEDGYIKVVAIIPGSASWRQKQLKAEDKILKVAQGDDEPVDLAEASVNEAVRLIRGKKGTEVRLTVQKPDGQVRVISIIRDVVVLEESYAKSALLTVPGGARQAGLKTGYISLPSFYHDFQNPKGRNSASDVRRELERLKAQGAEAIVLDLRNNGGGSLDDAVRMAGLFLPWGPMVQVKDRRGAGDVLEDIDPAVVFAGPLVVMVNTFSASASEILAAAMQDYGRAVIVGADTTFGKGTVQQVIDLDNFAGAGESGLKPLGSLKLTVQKFYRVNGGSTQFKGVVPDILIPDAYTELDVGEKSLEHALPWDAARPLRVQRWFDAPPLPQLQSKSRARVAANPYFKRLHEALRDQARFRDREKVTLQMVPYFAERDKSRREADSLEALQKRSSGLMVTPLASLNPAFAADSVEQEKVNDWKQQLSRDHTLREAVHVLEDWVEISKKDD